MADLAGPQANLLIPADIVGVAVAHNEQTPLQDLLGDGDAVAEKKERKAAAQERVVERHESPGNSENCPAR